MGALLAAVLVIAAITLLIVQTVNRHNADKARQAAASAAEEASLERTARDGAVECFVVWAGSGTTQDSVKGRHFPCTSVPQGSKGSGDPFWTVVTIKGVSSEAAARHNIWLFCTAGDSGLITGRSDSPPEPGTDMRAFVAGTAVSKSDPLDQIDCEVRTNHGVVRTVHIAMTMAGSR
jgi:hypothetical protein